MYMIEWLQDFVRNFNVIYVFLYSVLYAEYDYPTNNTLSALRKNQYDTLLPKVPVVGQTSQPGK